MFGAPVWNLFLDDLRNPDDPAAREVSGAIHYGIDQWVICRSTEEALREVAARGMPAYMSLDHDLGGDDTTMVFLRRLIDELWVGEIPPNYLVHSQNPVGRENIISFMDSWAKATNCHSTNVQNQSAQSAPGGAGFYFGVVGTCAPPPPKPKRKTKKK